MNNQNIAYSPLSFKSEDDARRYFKNNDIDQYISTLYGQCDSLTYMSESEAPISHGMGQIPETPSSFLSGYISNEASRLNEMLKYFNGESPRLGYKWVWSTHGNQEVQQHLDLAGATQNHPVFIEYAIAQGLAKSRYKEAFDFWLDCQKNLSVNNMFKLAYKFKMENLVPNGTKVLKAIRQSSKYHKRKT